MSSENKDSTQSAGTSKSKKSSPKCGKCDVCFKPRAKTVQCSTCSTRFHISCQDISEAKYEFLTNANESDGVLWFCYICRKTTRGVVNQLANIEIRLQSVEAGRKKDHNEIGLNNSVQNLQQKCGELESKIKQLTEKTQQCEENNGKTLQTVMSLQRDLYKEHSKNLNLQSKLDEMYQKRRENNVRVVGFPEEIDDSNIQEKLVEVVGASQVLVNDICSVTRMGKKKEDKPRDLVVQFVTKKKRDAFYAMRKQTPKNEENKKVYINEDLTETRAKLFYDTRQMVKRNKLYGTWSQNGNIMVKVKENDSPCVIQNHQDLASKTRYVTSDSDSMEEDTSSMSDIFEY